jgi:hypothetical protein
LLGLLFTACDNVVTPSHSHDIGDATMKVATPGFSENAIFAADSFRSDKEAQFLPSQADDGIGTPHPTSSHKKNRHITKHDGRYKNGGASGLSHAGEHTSEAGNDNKDEETAAGAQEKTEPEKAPAVPMPWDGLWKHVKHLWASKCRPVLSKIHKTKAHGTMVSVATVT